MVEYWNIGCAAFHHVEKIDPKTLTKTQNLSAVIKDIPAEKYCIDLITEMI
jgi:hypothetical protein